MIADSLGVFFFVVLGNEFKKLNCLYIALIGVLIGRLLLFKLRIKNILISFLINNRFIGCVYSCFCMYVNFCSAVDCIKFD